MITKGLKYDNLKENIQKAISEIPKEKYENIFFIVLYENTYYKIYKYINI